MVTTPDHADGLPAPAVSVELASEVAARLLGGVCRVTPLGSQQDANFLVTDGTGRRATLKIANPAFSRSELEAQGAAVAHLAPRLPGLSLPSALAGGALVDVDVDGTPHLARLLAWVDGAPLAHDRYVAPVVAERFGRLVARVLLGLADFEHPGLDRSLQWDLRRAVSVVADLVPRYCDGRSGAALLGATAEAAGALAGVTLPAQAIHGDLTGDNVTVAADADGRPEPVGVIDFGDLMRSWAVGELAVTCAALLHRPGVGVATVHRAVAACHRLRPLSDDEIGAFWPLVVLRGAVLVASGRQQVAVDAGNGYAAANLGAEAAVFAAATAHPLPVLGAQLAADLGRPVRSRSAPPAAGAGLLPGTAAVAVDLSVTSAHLDNGAWIGPDAESAVVANLLGAAGGGVVVTRHGEARLTASEPDARRRPPTVAVGTGIHHRDPLRLRAPWATQVVAAGPDWLTLAAGGLAVRIEGVVPVPAVAAALPAGADLGEGRAALRVVAHPVGGPVPPALVDAEVAAGWLALCPDPTALVAPSPPVPPGPSGVLPPGGAPGLLRRRTAVLAEVQEHYYEAPPEIERGWRHHLVDTSGRVYVDMVNNVTVLGHGHPVLAEAVARQWRLLNTNSRFHYEAVVALGEALTGRLPAGLDTVFLVNSGTEANDLALRVAWAATGRRDVVAVREAYHGWSDATDAVSTSVADNPAAVGTRPGWVHTLDAPNAYRGRHRGPDARRYAPEAAAAIARLAGAGRAPAAFISEAFYGNAGGVALPDGYLAEVYAAVRAAGGLAIADEVQVGYGRLGEWFWGFEQQGVVPDIVTVAKAMGNGHPLGAVVTRREIADAYRSQGYFFSSAGGSPVSAVVGTTVLDLLDAEGLQDNARLVGAHLRARLEDLARRHPIIGAVHGAGLYLGVELVRDRTTLEPAADETAAICERLRELGVIVQPTSDRLCVLKVKPPMCLTRASADVFVDALDEVLTTGW